MTQLVQVNRWNAHLFAGLTFPRYRPLLLTELGQRRTVAVGLVSSDQPAGLGLVELRARGVAQLRSVFVAPELRRKGHATRLIAEMEQRARALGCTELRAVYMADVGSRPPVESLLVRCGFEPPRLRMYVFRCTLEAIQAARWLRRNRLDPSFSIFPWRELREDEREAMIRRQRETGSLSVEVFPFNYGPHFEPNTSFGMRWNGEVVGWCTNYRYDDSTLRLTCSYLRDDLQKLGRLVALYARVVSSMGPAGFTAAIWTVPVEFPRMVQFVRRHVLPYARLAAETRGAHKPLALPAPPAE